MATNGGNYDQGQAVLDELARGLDKLVCAPRDAAPQPTATEGATRTDGTSEITRQRTVTPHPTQGART